MIRSENILKLEKEFNENKNSHVFLVETNNLDLCLEDIKRLIINILDKTDKNIYYQIENETFLELIVIRPEGKDIKKDKILELQNRLKITPILSKYIFYIITDASLMNEIAANKLLKTIEEPNLNVIGFLITQNEDLILPTIKSRCTNISAVYEENNKTFDVDEEIIKKTGELIREIENKNHIKFYDIKQNDIIRDNYKLVENLIKDYYNTACNLKTNEGLDDTIIDFIKNNNDYQTLIKKTKLINKLLNKLSVNMNGDLLLEKLYLQLKGV